MVHFIFQSPISSSYGLVQIHAQHDIFFIWRITTKQAAGLETWDYDESTYVIIENRSVLLDRSVDIQGF